MPTVLDNDIALLVSQQGTDNFKITDNLERLLRHLRLKDEPRRLWIDQVCINQDGQHEKGSQIRLMAEIYAGASCVVI